MPISYYVDRGGGGLRQDLGNGQLGPLISQLPAPYSDYVVGPTRLYNPNDLGDYIPLSRVGNDYLVSSEQGWASIQSEIAMENLNQLRSTQVEYRIAGDVEYVDTNGEVTTISIPGVAIAPSGYRLVWAYAEGGGESITKVPMGSTLRDLNASGALYSRWVRPEEALQYAVGSYLLHRQIDELMNIGRDQGFRKLDGSIDYMEAMVYLLNSNIGAMQAYTHQARRIA